MTSTPMAALLQDLEVAHLIRLDLGSEGTGTFRHVLIQDSTYESLLRPERRDLTREVGETLERLALGRTDDVAGVMAHHYDEGGETAKALRLYVRAGELASRRSLKKNDLANAGRELEVSLERMHELGLDLAQWRAFASLAEIRRRQHRQDQARQCRQEAVDRVERIASSLPDSRLQELFRSRKDVRAVWAPVV